MRRRLLSSCPHLACTACIELLILLQIIVTFVLPIFFTGFKFSFMKVIIMRIQINLLAIHRKIIQRESTRPYNNAKMRIDFFTTKKSFYHFSTTTDFNSVKICNQHAINLVLGTRLIACIKLKIKNKIMYQNDNTLTRLVNLIGIVRWLLFTPQFCLDNSKMSHSKKTAQVYDRRGKRQISKN